MLGRGKGLLLAAALTTFACVPSSAGAHGTTLDHTITGDGSPGFEQLQPSGPWPRIVREELAPAQPGRDTTRSSLTYFGQLTDFQLSDEESPARVELLDIDGTPFTAAWRPQEALVAFMTDQAIRALNDNLQSPHLQGDGSPAPMDLTLVTGDQADSNQRNEVEWVVRLLEGGTITPNSGVEDNLPICGENGEAARYTGVQDYDDFAETDAFYDPDIPTGKWGAWPLYPGLMDAAQREFEAEGSRVPTYVTNGNHDMLAQGNGASNLAYEVIATGCAKHFLPMPFSSPSPTVLETHPEKTVDVPADPNRQYVNRTQIRELHANGEDGHGFDFVDQQELTASNGAASYYSFSPKPGLRLISIDTLSEAGIPGPSASGSIDDPQFQWLKRELDAAEQAGELIIVFGHHPIRTLTANLPDELAPPCTVNDAHGHDVNPGCDQDPRSSSPIRLGADLQTLLLAHRHVIAYVSGHTHEHNIDAFARPDGSGGFWGIETSAIVDWPVQARVIEVMDNEDGTLSIFGTIIDHEGPITAPEPGPEADASTFLPEVLASIGRTLAYNDPQAGAGSGEGAADDRNVELLLDDPRN